MLPHVPVCDVLIYFVHPVGDDWPMPRVYELGFQVYIFFNDPIYVCKSSNTWKAKLKKLGISFNSLVQPACHC